MDRVGIYFVDTYPLRDELKWCQLAEKKGFECAWQGESRLSRESTVSITAIATVTEKLKVGTGVLHTWTRNVAILAVTFATINELSNGRAQLGIGVLWEPMASKIGIERKKPFKAMREHVEVLQRLFRGEIVNFDGEFVKVHDIHLERKVPYVPVYIGATGFQMMELAGEIADGVVMNYLVSPEYNKKALEHIKNGAKKTGRSLGDVDRPQLIAVSMDEDEDKAIKYGRRIVAEYLGQEPHIMKASGVKDELIKEINEILGGWPARPGSLDIAEKKIPDDVVRNIVVAGTPEDCRRRVKQYVETGCTVPLLTPVSPSVTQIIEAFSEGYS